MIMVMMIITVVIMILCGMFNPLSANPTKWSNTLKLSVFDHFVQLALTGVRDWFSVIG